MSICRYDFFLLVCKFGCVTKWYQKHYNNVNLVQAEATVGDVARETPRISVALENRQADHQTSMFEIEGMINIKPISILVDLGASLSYISLGIVEKCDMSLRKFEKSWLGQLATGTKRKVVNFIESCEISTNDFQTHVNLNVLPLGSYDALIGIDWLEKHKFILNCFEKTFTCLNEKEETVVVKEIPRKVYVRQISALQMKMSVRKGCKGFVVHVTNNEKDEDLKLADIPVTRDFADVFLEEFPGLRPKRELDFSIELIPGTVPVSKAPYRMNILELTELKTQLKELIDKNYIRPSVFPWGAPVMFVKKKDETLRLCIDYR